MNELIQVVKSPGEIYVTYVIFLMLFNSFVKKVFWKPQLSAKKIIGTSSAIMLVAFWFWGASFWKLLFFTFFTFGFYDWFGRYVEQLAEWIVFQIKEQSKALIVIIKKKLKR